MTVKHSVLIGLLALLLVGCSFEDLADAITPDAETQYAQDFLQRLLDRDFEYVISQVDDSLIDQVTDEKLAEIADYFPTGEQLSVEIIGSHVNISSSRWRGSFTLEYQFESGWAIASIAMKRVDDEITVTGFTVYQTTASQRELTAFTAVDFTPLRIFVLILTVAVPIFMIFTCYKVYQTPIPVKKKRWYVISFLGLTELSFNWTTGVLGFQILMVQLLGAGAVAAGSSAPWILEFTLPVGAVLFWMKRKDLMTRPDSEGPNEATIEPPVHQ